MNDRALDKALNTFRPSEFFEVMKEFTRKVPDVQEEPMPGVAY